MDSQRGPWYRDRAARLLRRVVNDTQFDPGRVAEELVVGSAELDAYGSGRVRIPIERQLCLALLVIERMPGLARAGYLLHAQVCAVMRYDAQLTGIHAAAPTKSSLLKPPLRRPRQGQ